MAKAFSFRLDPVLRYRKHLEEQKKRELAESRRAVRDQNRALLGLLRDEAGAKEGMKEIKGRGTIDVSRLRLQEQYLNSVARRIRSEYETLQRKLGAEEGVRRELTEARKKVRVLERLKERRLDAHRRDEGRAEQKEQDEIGMNIRFRRGEAAS